MMGMVIDMIVDRVDMMMEIIVKIVVMRDLILMHFLNLDRLFIF